MEFFFLYLRIFDAQFKSPDALLDLIYLCDFVVVVDFTSIVIFKTNYALLFVWLLPKVDCFFFQIITKFVHREVNTMAKDVFDENLNDRNESNYYDQSDIEKEACKCMEEQEIIDIENGDQQLEEIIPLEVSKHLSSNPLLYITSSIKQHIVAITFLFIAVLFNLTILAIIHERVPHDDAPLPDISFDILPKNDRALDISEFIIIFMSTSTILMIFFHRYRSIILRRLCLMLGVLYFFRGICMAVTQVPVANQQYYCSPRLNRTIYSNPWQMIKIIFSRVAHMSLGMGLSVNGRHSFCGDYIFSGHTVVLVISKFSLQFPN